MIRYLELPKIPDDILQIIPTELNKYHCKINYGTYNWSDSFNQELNAWGQQYICKDMYFAFQLMTGDVPIHKDIGTKTKLVYLLCTGGDNVITNFYNKNNKCTHSYHIELHRWHILQASRKHSVDGIVPGSLRLSVTGRIF
jgi:hypothetical protein